MQITETKLEGLDREYKILIAASEIEEKVTFKLQEMAQSARLPGFRPGKVPTKLLRQRYGNQVIGEILESAVSDSSRQVLTEKGVRPVSQPDIQVTSFEEGKDLEYTLAIEIFPQITPMDFSTITLERLEPIQDSKKIKAALENIARAHKITTPIKTKRKSKNGDIIIFDFVGSIDGKIFPGSTAEKYSLELGSNSFIPGFEEQLVGIKSGDQLSVNVKFPEKYQAEDLAGKNAVFECKIREIHDAEPAQINDELAKKVGMSDLNALKEAIKEEQNREFEQMSRLYIKRQLLDTLESKHDFELPKKMIESEYKNIAAQIEKDEKSAKKNKKSEDAEFQKIAKRRVKLGLLLSEIGRINSIELSQDDIKQAMLEETKKHPGEEQKIMDYFKNNPKAIEQFTAPIYEDKVVDFILNLSTVVEKQITMDDLIKTLENENKADSKKKLSSRKKTTTTQKSIKSTEATKQPKKNQKTSTGKTK